MEAGGFRLYMINTDILRIQNRFTCYFPGLTPNSLIIPLGKQEETDMLGQKEEAKPIDSNEMEKNLIQSSMQVDT